MLLVIEEEMKSALLAKILEQKKHDDGEPATAQDNAANAQENEEGAEEEQPATEDPAVD